MKMPIAIVTGSYGYIGTVLTKILSENNYYVIGIDRNPKAQNCWVNENTRTKYCNEFLNADFVSAEALHILNEHQDATIFHLAAESLLGPSSYLPLTYFENNTAKTLKLIQNLKSYHKLIFASTAAVYEQTSSVLTEGSKIGPPNNYGKSKLWCEEIINSCYNLKSLRAIAFRFFNVIGAYGDVGQQENTPHIINKLCDKAFNDDTPFVIAGNDYPTNDGTCVRDYVHVIDVCRAMIHGAKFLEKEKDSCFHKFNLGTGVGHSVEEIALIFSMLCRKIETRIGVRRDGDPASLIANPTSFVYKTGFEYKYKATDIDLMIRDHWEFRKNGN